MTPGSVSARPTVLFVGHSAKRSGGELALAQLLRYLPHAGSPGFDCRIALFEAGEMEEIYAERNVRVHDHLHGMLRTEVRRSAGARALAAESVRTASSLLAVRRAMLTTQPNIIVTNSMKASVATQLAFADGGVPIVHFVREPLTAPNFDNRQAALVRRILARGSLQIANSPATAQTLRGRTQVLLPPVETPASLAGPSLTCRASEVRLLILGSVSTAKGQARAIEELAPLLASHSASPIPVKLDVVGSAIFAGDDTEAAALQNLVDRLGIRDAVRFWPWTGDPFTAIADAHVVIVPSQVQEGFSQVAAQALIAGVPTVLPANAGIVSAINLPTTARPFAWDVSGSFGGAVAGALELARAQARVGGRLMHHELARALSPSGLAEQLDDMLRKLLGLAVVEARNSTSGAHKGPVRNRPRARTKVHA